MSTLLLNVVNYKVVGSSFYSKLLLPQLLILHKLTVHYFGDKLVPRWMAIYPINAIVPRYLMPVYKI